MKKIIQIRKKGFEPANAIRVNHSLDIPEFLWDTIKIGNKKINLISGDGTETCPLGSVIGYRTSTNTPTGWTGWTAWHIPKAIANATLTEIGGSFYKKPSIFLAQLVDDKLPEFLKGAKIIKNGNGSWTIINDWFRKTGFPGEAYWVLYGIKGNGTPNATIITKSEQEYLDYIVCDKNGTDICALAKMDPP